MSYIPLTDPFEIRFIKDDRAYEATVTYVTAKHCCGNFYDVAIHKPEEIPSFLLKERPGPDPEHTTMVWMDDKEKVNMLYQYIGIEIEQHLKKNLGIYLIDAPLAYKEVDMEHPDTHE